MADETDLKAPPKDEVPVRLGPDPGQAKVELDLDDAPFLQVPEENSPAVQEGDAPAIPEGDEDAARNSRKKKKLIIVAGAGATLLLILGVAGWWFFLRTPPPSPDISAPEVVVVPSKPAVQAKPDYLKEFAPFLVPGTDAKGQTRFLICRFSALSKDPGLGKEMDHKMISLRDAMYYYLRSKSSDYLMDSQNGPAIKKDLTAVLNDYLTQGKIEDILFESYLNE
ncbi:flagellar basal body-associated protein FliL [uncultured Desulfovibrio sp.]|uniref:flagellar basal body-associated FliL family protein n=1 Tax=uncultured Desulfovibrio sp. TaxID=167968 RepID=UPI0003A1D17E|nr:flagellar basal body-associated FliL family protein [uncultured Desulfovibrio sp.]